MVLVKPFKKVSKLAAMSHLTEDLLLVLFFFIHKRACISCVCDGTSSLCHLLTEVIIGIGLIILLTRRMETLGKGNEGNCIEGRN